MVASTRRENRLRQVSVGFVLLALAVATACSAPDETSTSTPSAPTTSAKPTTSPSPAAQADPNTEWAESVCSAARDVRSSLEAIGGNLGLDPTASASALDQVKSTLKAQVAATRTSMTELETAIEAIPIDAEGAAELKNSLDAARGSLDDAVQAVSEGVNHATAANNARDFVTAAAQTTQAVKEATSAAEASWTTAQNAATAAGGETRGRIRRRSVMRHAHRLTVVIGRHSRRCPVLSGQATEGAQDSGSYVREVPGHEHGVDSRWNLLDEVGRRST